MDAAWIALEQQSDPGSAEISSNLEVFLAWSVRRCPGLRCNSASQQTMELNPSTPLAGPRYLVRNPGLEGLRSRPFTWNRVIRVYHFPARLE